MFVDPGVTIGIDLGTTNSVVATVQDGAPLVIPARDGQRLTPSVVAIARNGKRLVGSIAKRQAITNPEQTVYGAKRLIGRRFSSEQVQQARRVFPYVIVAGDHDEVLIELGGRRMTVSEVGAIVLQGLRLDAEAFLGRPVTGAVITVPAHFNDGQRLATREAGRLAGFDVLRIVNEPTAAAIAYGFGRAQRGRLAVYDLGGGTFDVSVLEVDRGVFEVLATGGSTFLGGEDFDGRIIDWLASGFAEEHGIDLRRDKMALQRLKEAAERAKCELSSLRETRIDLPFLYTPPGSGTALHLQRVLSREKLEELTRDLVERTMQCTEGVLHEANLAPSEIDEVVLVGGQTRMPLVQDRVTRLFGREPCKGVHPEEVVALGGGIQAHALTSPDSEVLLLDVTPWSLGIMIAGGYQSVLVPRNTVLPTSRAHSFTTVKDNQTAAKILVLQGEGTRAEENEPLGEFLLTSLRPAPRGQVEIEVQIEVSADGIVAVSARDKETGQHQSITITAPPGIPFDEVDPIGGESRDRPVEPAATEKIERPEAEIRDLLAGVDHGVVQWIGGAP